MRVRTAGSTAVRASPVPPSAPRRTVHVVEPGGQGGIYQHTVALAEGLAEAGERVVLHTARDRELDPAGGVQVCLCVCWLREVKPARVRAFALVALYLCAAVHVAAGLRRRDVLHVQGGYKLPLTLMTLWLGRASGAFVVYSPHNTFVRDGRFHSLIALCERAADVCMVFTEADVGIVRSRGGRPRYTPLVQHVPVPDDGLMAAWRRRWNPGAGQKVVLAAGQVRPDKRLDLLLRAVAGDHGLVLAVVGDDVGWEAQARVLAAELGVEVRWATGYTPFDSFIAAIGAADAVACPYDRASQSGVLSLARALGTPSVATRVGGLAELADVVVPPGDSESLQAALHEVVLLPPRPAGREDERRAMILSHRAAYGWSA